MSIIDSTEGMITHVFIWNRINCDEVVNAT